LYLGVEKNINTNVSVPDFTGKTKKEILDIAESLGIKISFTGDGIGATQDVTPGKEVKKDSKINIILEKPED
jgi:stage V sporulation protein D (sporulation-specific penicillin-binding protein)